jgi:hypothetical protein
MRNRKTVLQALLCFILVASLILPTSFVGASSTTIAMTDDMFTIHSAVDDLIRLSGMVLNTGEVAVMFMVAACGDHMVGLKSDGTVVATGENGDSSYPDSASGITPVERPHGQEKLSLVY